MKLRKQRIGYWGSTILSDVGIILLAQSGLESRGYLLHPLLEFGALSLLPGIAIGIFTQRCPFCGKISRHPVLYRKKEFCPYCGVKFDDSKM